MNFLHSYIMDYASFNIACALPGSTLSCVYYKFDKHKWSKDEGANKVYQLLSDNIKTGDQLHTIERVALERIANSLETIARVMTIALSSAIGIGVGCVTSAVYK